MTSDFSNASIGGGPSNSPVIVESVGQPREDPLFGMSNRVLTAEEKLDAISPTGNTPDAANNANFSKILDLHSTANSDTYEGTVTLVLPVANWYRVHLDQGGIIEACKAENSNMSLFGSVSSQMIPATSRVVVWVPANKSTGIILGVIPSIDTSPYLAYNDAVSQPTVTGMKKEKIYSGTLTELEDGISGFVQASGRPEDQTSLDWSQIAATGVGIHTDPFMTFMRVDEATGVWGNYFDSHLRISAQNLDYWSPNITETSRSDEGELLHERAYHVYPWEALGGYRAGVEIIDENDESQSQYQSNVGFYEPAEPDAIPYGRKVTHEGYLGQGGYTLLTAPASEKSVKTKSDPGGEVGLFEQSLSLDGRMSMRSAKGFWFSKRPEIPVPARKADPENRKIGDDKVAENYRFSGSGSIGSEHKLSDITYSDEPGGHLAGVAGLSDLLAYQYNWKNLHPFHYHENDFSTPEEGDGPIGNNESLNFSELAGGRGYLSPPQFSEIDIDHRLKNVRYYRNSVDFGVTDDGGIVFRDGYGSSMIMAYGNIYFDCPGDIFMRSGMNLNMWAGHDLNAKAKSSLDLVASQKDVRIKSERNLQMLSGNSGAGGILLESRGGGAFDFEDIGENVSSSGIVLKSTKGPVATLAKDLYLRAGTTSDQGAEIPGNIWIDANQGSGDIHMIANNQLAYLSQSTTWFGNHADETFTPLASEAKSDQGTYTKGTFFVDGPFVAIGNSAIQGSLAIDAQGSGGIAIFDGHIASDKGGMVGELDDDEAEARFRSQLEEGTSSYNEIVEKGSETFNSGVVQVHYSDEGVGSRALQQNIGFTFRDDDEGSQYGVGEEWRTLQPYWQQLIQSGEASGGSDWEEKPVTQGSRKLYPYPGRKAMERESMVSYNDFQLYDPSSRKSLSRGEAYESFSLGELQLLALNTDYKSVG